MRLPEFDQAYRKACWDKFSVLTAQFQSVRAFALTIVQRLLRDPKITIRMRAANSLLQFTAETLAEVEDLQLRVQRLTQPQPQPRGSNPPDCSQAA